jgi:hypothetical protein
MSKYSVNAYAGKKFTGLMRTLGTDNIQEALNFISTNIGQGYCCELIDNTTNLRRRFDKNSLISK